MTTMADTLDQAILELDERERDGIRVTLVWSRATGRLSVLVSDKRTSAAFALDVAEGEDSLDVFHHPFAYAAFRGLLEDAPVAGPELAMCT